MFSKILIANRGEIAVRIIRACKEMGIATVAVYSQADAQALHVALADQSVCIGKADAADSYLYEDRIISAALATGAAAIHPGYGFLSENAHFALNCRKNAIVFIGPTVENMERLSDKATIKALMDHAGLPTIPGTGILADADAAAAAAAKFRRPVICFIDTSGANCGIGAEERGQGQAIAENLMEMMTLDTPVISILIGEGGSGGALALAVADRVWMLENAVYSVISPEGCASILWKDAAKAETAAENLKLTAYDALTLGIIERIIEENDLGQESFYASIRRLLTEELAVLTACGDLPAQRCHRFRPMGAPTWKKDEDQ